MLGFVLSLLLFRLIRLTWSMTGACSSPPRRSGRRSGGCAAILILTCTGVSFSHGTNDGQKSIGLIMLTIIGLLPAAYALNMTMTPQQVADRSPRDMANVAARLIERFRR